MRFGPKCSILNGHVIYIEKSKLNISNMQLIPLDVVTIDKWCGISNLALPVIATQEWWGKIQVTNG